MPAPFTLQMCPVLRVLMVIIQVSDNTLKCGLGNVALSETFLEVVGEEAYTRGRRWGDEVCARSWIVWQECGNGTQKEEVAGMSWAATILLWQEVC